MAATLTHAMLDDLHIGNASLSLLAYDASKSSLASLDFTGSDQLYTLEGSLNLSADDPSSTDIRIDQHQEVIDTQIEKGGNWRITGNVPSIASDLLKYFFTEGAGGGAVSGVKGYAGDSYSGSAFLATPEAVEVSILVESESKNTAILIPHVKMIVSKPKKDDNNNPAYLSFVGFILPNGMKDDQNKYLGDFAVLKAAA